MKRLILAVAALLLLAPTVCAQRPASFVPEVRTFAGAYVPMGAMRDDFKDAFSLGVQGAVQMWDTWHIVGSIGWSYAQSRVPALADDRTYLIHYDIGAESNLRFQLARGWRAKPFGGLGVGARAYSYDMRAVETRICTTGYGALGSELQREWLALRVEARQYLACFESPVTGDRKTRSDALFALGLAYHIR